MTKILKNWTLLRIKIMYLIKTYFEPNAIMKKLKIVDLESKLELIGKMS